MAKYTRYDPRNKKRGKHKSHSLERDIRLREVDHNSDKFNSRAILREVVFDDDNDYYDEPEFLRE